MGTGRGAEAISSHARRIPVYPVHRQRLPATARRGSTPDSSAQVRATTNPGVQKPHCTAPAPDQGAMDRAELIPSKALGRDHMAAGHHRHGGQAAVVQLVAGLGLVGCAHAHEHHAGPAVAGAAPGLGGSEVTALAQEVQHG